MTTPEPSLNPDEIRISFVVPKAAVAAWIVLTLVSGAMIESMDLPNIKVKIALHGGGERVANYPEHAEERAPIGTYIGSTVIVVASTSVSSSAIPVILEPGQTVEGHL